MQTQNEEYLLSFQLEQEAEFKFELLFSYYHYNYYHFSILITSQLEQRKI